MFLKELCVSAKEQQYALRRGALRLRVHVQTGPISPHKSLALPQKRFEFSWNFRQRAPRLWKRMLLCMLTRCARITSASVKELCIAANEPYITAKEPYMPSKEPYIPAKELCNILKEPYISAKEPCIPARVCTLTRCGDVTCSAATTSARVTSTPRPTTTVRNSTWGRRYTLLRIYPFIPVSMLHSCTCLYVFAYAQKEAWWRTR